MKPVLLCGAAAVLLLAVPAAAENSSNNNAKSVDPQQLGVHLEKPALKLDEQQRAAIQNGMVGQHTQQTTPDGFKPEVGAVLPKGVKVDIMPHEVTAQVPAMKQYGYAKTTSDILVVDPMNIKIVAVVPRKFAADPNTTRPTPLSWASTRGRELTGQAPQPVSDAERAGEGKGDPAAVGNGRAQNADPQESGVDPSYQAKH